MWRRRRERDLDDEIDSHLAMAIDDRVRNGEDPDAARLAALKEFGNVAQTREATRMAWGARWVEHAGHLVRDIRYAARLLARSPAYSLVVIAVLAIGIGANIVAFGYYKALTLTPLPGVRDSARLHVLGAITKADRHVAVPYRDYQHIRDHNRVYTGVAASTFGPYTLGTGAAAQRVYGEMVSGNYFELLAVGAQLGRTLQPADDRVPRGHPVVVLSDSLWRRRFSADPGVIGRLIQVNSVPLTVVGVAAPDFHGTIGGIDIELFVPIMMQPVLSGGWNALDNPATEFAFALGRPRPGVTLETAREDARRLGAQIQALRPASEFRERVVPVTVRNSPQGIQTYGGPLVGLVGIAAGLLLVVVCANVAGLVLVRTLARRTEMAARLALGATRQRVARLLLLETLLLALPGAVLGLAAPQMAYDYVVGKAAGGVGAHVYVNVQGGPLVAAALVLACASAVLCGLLPGLSASRVDLAATLKDAASPIASSLGRARAALVVCQVAMALMLLVGAALITRSLQAARLANPGFDPRDTASIVVDVRPAGYNTRDGWRFYQRLQEDLRRLDGVEAVSLMRTPLLMVWDFGGRQFIPEGYAADDENDLRAGFNIVTAGHFDTLKIPLLAGRDFRHEEPAERVAIINETFARQYWRTPAGAIGKRLTMADWTSGAPTAVTVIGVARDIKYQRLNEKPRPYVYLPVSQAYVTALSVLVRGQNPGPAFLDRVRQRVRALAPTVPILESFMLVEQTNLSFALYDVAARVLRVVGLAGIGLAALGIYGLVAYSVKQRTREIGIRVAIGAARSAILRQYLTAGLWLGGIGMLVGIAGAAAGSRVMAALLFGVTATDVLSFTAASGLVLGIVLIASFVPAWRGSRVNPVVALRHH